MALAALGKVEIQQPVGLATETNTALGLILGLVSNIDVDTAKAYVTDLTMAAGDLPFIDRPTFQLTSIPANALNKEFIRTANDDKNTPLTPDADFLRFTLTTSGAVGADVVVWHDSRLSANRPAWLSAGNGWQSIADNVLLTTGSTNTHNGFVKHFNDGQVTLGANHDGPSSISNCNMYLVSVLQGTPYTGGGPQVIPVGLAATVNLALPLSIPQTVAVGQAVETDTAFVVTVQGGPTVIELGLATETDSALVVTVPPSGGAAPDWYQNDFEVAHGPRNDIYGQFSDTPSNQNTAPQDWTVVVNAAEAGRNYTALRSNNFAGTWSGNAPAWGHLDMRPTWFGAPGKLDRLFTRLRYRITQPMPDGETGKIIRWFDNGGATSIAWCSIRVSGGIQLSIQAGGGHNSSSTPKPFRFDDSWQYLEFELDMRTSITVRIWHDGTLIHTGSAGASTNLIDVIATPSSGPDTGTFPDPSYFWIDEVAFSSQFMGLPASSTVISSLSFDWANDIQIIGESGPAPGSDNWPLIVSDDGPPRQYTSWGDGGGFRGTNNNGRVSLGYGRLEYATHAALRADGPNYNGGVNIWGGLNPENAAQYGGKVISMWSLNGNLYGWYSPSSNTGAFNYQRIVKSTDKGATWTDPRPADGNELPQSELPGGTGNPGLPYTAVSGPDQQPNDGFLYTFCIEILDASIWEVQGGSAGAPTGTNFVRLFRSPIANEAFLDRANDDWWTGIDAFGEPVWGLKANRGALITEPDGLMRGTCFYNWRLNRYIMTQNHTTRNDGNMWFAEAEYPWGPWKQVVRFDLWADAPSMTFCSFSPGWLTTNGLTTAMSFFRPDAWCSVPVTFVTP